MSLHANLSRLVSAEGTTNNAVFDVQQIRTLWIKRYYQEALNQFNRTIKNAPRSFMIYEIKELWKIGMQEQAVTLFDETIEYAEKSFSIPNIIALWNLGMKAQAVTLFDQTIEYAEKSFSALRIIAFWDIGMQTQAVMLFNRTVNFINDQMEPTLLAAGISLLYNSGMTEQAFNVFVTKWREIKGYETTNRIYGSQSRD